MTLPVAILAGGVATRLRPITLTIPKSLVEVAGKPFVVRQLEYLRSQGITSVVLCIGHLGEQVEEVVGDGSAFGLGVRYSADGGILLGTGGALVRALPLLGEEFFVLYGDSFLPVDLQEIEQAYRQSGKPALMTVLRNENAWDRSNVAFDHGTLREYNKHAPRPDMQYIDYGLGVLTRAALDSAPASGVFDLAETYHYLSMHGHLAGHEVFSRFYEIGSHAGLADTVDYFRQHDSR